MAPRAGTTRIPAARLLTAVMAAFVVVTPVQAATGPPVAIDTCVACHGALSAPLNSAVEGMKHDIHGEKGLSCADCHGGDPTVMDATAMAPEGGFRGTPKPTDIPAFCGRCHADGAYMRRFNPSLATDQLQQYWTSVHGQRLRTGDTRVATCVGCHGVHGILPADRAQSRVFPANVPATCGGCHSDREHMAGYGIPTDQEEQYRRSVHAELLLVRRDLSAPACNDCHGNHGAFPPGVTSVAGVCGQCHAINAQLFLHSPHKVAFERLDLPACAVCHLNHDVRRTNDAMLGGDAGGMCRTCHEPGTPGHAAAVRMRHAIDQLSTELSATETVVARAHSMGMEVSDEQYALREDIRPKLVAARTQTHSFDADVVDAAVKDGLAGAAAARASAEATLAEAEARRRNLLLPLAVILVLMGLLYLKLRQLERGPGP